MPGPRIPGFSRAAVLSASLALALGLAAPVTGADPGATPLELGPEVEALLDPPAVVPDLPPQPGAALTGAVAALGSEFGVPLEPAVPTAAARLPEGVSGRLALLVRGLLDCQLAAVPARQAISDPAAAGALSVPPRDVPGAVRASLALEPVSVALRACAGRLQALALEAGSFLATVPEEERGDGLDLWPVLRYSPGEGAERYAHDYALIVDGGGDDLYLNNAGGSLLDLKRGPPGAPSPERAPARGCHKLPLDFPGECFAGVALLLDVAGNDTYGMREKPDPTNDGFCTPDPLVRRIATGGAGLIGVGILIDEAGDDHYVSKTLSQGSGHIAGVGVLRDLAGDDHYLAIRTSQGFALIAGLGLLRDEDGDDVFERYTPGPLDPEAGYQRPGSGGVIDDRGTCDTLPRQLQGSAFLPGSVGILVNIGGNDSYQGAPPATQRSDAFMFPHGSQGYGGNGGFGILDDMGNGRDTYREVPGRGDGVTIGPSPDSAGLFRDDG